MNTHEIIPVTQKQVNGQSVQMVNARILHQFLGVRRDFSSWIKNRIEEYDFEAGGDYVTSKQWGNGYKSANGDFSPNLGKTRGRPAIDYFATLSMAKELTMVERTPKGKQARQYFIACEKQLRQIRQQAITRTQAIPVELSRAEKQAINRQAWAEVSGQVHATFHQRREELLQERVTQPGPIYLPYGFVPEWAK